MTDNETMVSVHDATHVRLLDGRIERIVAKWGIDADGHVAKPSEGGFGVVTESGERVSMWEAKAYYKREPEWKTVTLELTTLEQAALVGILVEFVLQPDSTREWIDVATGQVVTIEELLKKVSS